MICLNCNKNIVYLDTDGVCHHCNHDLIRDIIPKERLKFIDTLNMMSVFCKHGVIKSYCFKCNDNQLKCETCGCIKVFMGNNIRCGNLSCDLNKNIPFYDRLSIKMTMNGRYGNFLKS